MTLNLRALGELFEILPGLLLPSWVGPGWSQAIFARLDRGLGPVSSWVENAEMYQCARLG
jgi:hypothetical protein